MNRMAQLLPILCLGFAAGCQPGAGIDPAITEAALDGTETSRDFGDYVVHFNAIPTSQLSPDVARQYDIVRSDNRALLNISIIRKEEGTLGASVSGAVSVSAINLNSQLRRVPVREIREEAAIYYIGEVAVSDEETLVFTIDVTPLNESSRFTIRYMKQFFVD